MHLGIQVEDICYRALHETSGYSTKYWTMPELFRYARDKLHVNYMFWVRIPKSDAGGRVQLEVRAAGDREQPRVLSLGPRASARTPAQLVSLPRACAGTSPHSPA